MIAASCGVRFHWHGGLAGVLCHLEHEVLYYGFHHHDDVRHGCGHRCAHRRRDGRGADDVACLCWNARALVYAVVLQLLSPELLAGNQINN